MVIPHPETDPYALLTRPPLPGLPPAVRLACVKHAASVRSEPGSNSQVHHVPIAENKTNKPCLADMFRPSLWSKERTTSQA
jgi:hypothetical protein